MMWQPLDPFAELEQWYSYAPLNHVLYHLLSSNHTLSCNKYILLENKRLRKVDKIDFQYSVMKVILFNLFQDLMPDLICSKDVKHLNKAIRGKVIDFLKNNTKHYGLYIFYICNTNTNKISILNISCTPDQ